jgi:type I restriction enzyme, R subunit
LAIEYEEYLKRIADLVRRVTSGQGENTPAQMNTPGRRALFNNLHRNETLAAQIDEVVKRVRPDGWRGVQPREQIIKAELYRLLQDENEVERIFLIIKQQKEY